MKHRITIILTLTLALPALAAAQKNDYVATVSFNTDSNATSQTLNETDLESLLDQIDIWTIHEHGLTEAPTSRTLGGELFGPARDEYLMYALDEDSGSTLTDQVGRTDIILLGTTADAATTTGVVGDALMLSAGSAESITLPRLSDALTTGQDFTLCFWWRADLTASDTLNTTNTYMVDSFNGNYDGPFVQWSVAGANTIRTRVRSGLSDGTNGTNFDEIWDNCDDANWHLYGLVRDGSEITPYRDGEPGAFDRDTSTSGSERLDNSRHIRVSDGPYGSSGAPGAIDDFRVYKRALSQSEIEGLYNEGSGTASHVGALRGVDGFLKSNQIGLGEVRAEWDTSSDELDLYADDEKFMTIRHRSSYEPEFGIGTDSPEAALHVDDSASTPVIISNRDGMKEGQNAFIQFDGAQHSSDTSLYNIVTYGIAGGDASVSAPGPGNDEWNHTAMIKMGIDNGTTSKQVWVPVYEPK